MSEGIIGEATLKDKVDAFLGDDGEVSTARWFRRSLRQIGFSDRWLDRRYKISEWWDRRFDSDITNDAH